MGPKVHEHMRGDRHNRAILEAPGQPFSSDRAVPARIARGVDDHREHRKARIGKEAFLAVVPGAVDAAGARVRAWLEQLELAHELGARWSRSTSRMG